MKILKLCLITLGAIVVLLGLPGTAQAIPINGTISFSGDLNMDGTDFISATKFTGFQNVVVGSGSTGDYSSVSQGQGVSMNGFTWKPLGASVVPLWTFNDGTKNYAFDLNTLFINAIDPRFVVMTGVGIAHIDGYDPTPGDWVLSANQFSMPTITFSSSNRSPVPDGGTTIAMLGGAFLGLGMMSRKRVLA